MEMVLSRKYCEMNLKLVIIQQIAQNRDYAGSLIPVSSVNQVIKISDI